MVGVLHVLLLNRMLTLADNPLSIMHIYIYICICITQQLCQQTTKQPSVPQVDVPTGKYLHMEMRVMAPAGMPICAKHCAGM